METKENLPISFITDMVSKGWDEVGYLKEASAAISTEYQNTTEVEGLMQDLIDAYLIFIGQLEQYLHREEDIIVNAETMPAPVEKDKDIEVIPKAPEKSELPKAKVDIAPVTDVSQAAIGAEISDFDDIETTTSSVASNAEEPFEFFVDFDEPDLSQPHLTDDDIYPKDTATNRTLRS